MEASIFDYSLKSCCLMRKHQKTKVCFLLQSEELLSDEKASEDKSLFFITV